MSSRRGWVSLAVRGILAIATASLLLLPVATATGAVSYLVTSGQSMQPLVQSGDLVFIRGAEDYTVGDIVAYQNPQLGAVALHRIIDRSEGRFVLQGDNNDWVDGYEPTASEIAGRWWLRIPRAGTWLQRAGSPFGVGIATLLLLGAARTSITRRRRRAAPPEPASAATPGEDEGSDEGADAGSADAGGRPQTGAATRPEQRPPRLLLGPAGLAGLGVLAALMLAAGALTALAWSAPTQTRTSDELSYTHSATFDLHASVPRGPVYPDGEVETGEPVFLSHVDALKITVAHELSGVGDAATAPLVLTGDHRLIAELHEQASGWRRALELTPEATFEGTEPGASGRLDLTALTDLAAAVTERTGLPDRGWRVTLRAELDATGTFGGAPLEETLTAETTLRLEDGLLVPAADDSGDDQGAATTHSVERSRTVPATVGIDPAVLTTETARWLGPATLAAALIGLLGLAVAARRAAGKDEPVRLRRRYGRRLVEAVEVSGGRTGVIELADFADLARLAEQFDEPIVAERTPHGQRYLVQGTDRAYSYHGAPPAGSAAPAGEPVASANGHRPAPSEGGRP